MNWIDIKDTSRLINDNRLYLVDIDTSGVNSDGSTWTDKDIYICYLCINDTDNAMYFITKDGISHQMEQEDFKISDAVRYMPIEP